MSRPIRNAKMLVRWCVYLSMFVIINALFITLGLETNGHWWTIYVVFFGIVAALFLLAWAFTDD